MYTVECMYTICVNNVLDYPFDFMGIKIHCNSRDWK